MTCGLEDPADCNASVDITRVTSSDEVRCPLCGYATTSHCDLRRLVKTWTSLPADIRSVMMRLVRSMESKDPSK